MDLTRRAFTGTTAAVLAASAGCIGVLTGAEAYEEVAAFATVSESALEETGYELENKESPEIERDVEIGGQERTVRATNRLVEYQRSVELGLLGEVKGAAFATFSTPAFEIAGRTFNPVGDYSNRELADMVTSNHEDLSVGDEVDTETVTMLGTETEVTKFEAQATLKGQQVDLYLHVTKMRDGDDFVIAIGTYPREISDEEERVFALVEGLQHEADG